jgi:hypothetical protein
MALLICPSTLNDSFLFVLISNLISFAAVANLFYTSVASDRDRKVTAMSSAWARTRVDLHSIVPFRPVLIFLKINSKAKLNSRGAIVLTRCSVVIASVDFVCTLARLFLLVIVKSYHSNDFNWYMKMEH